jgi:HEAT repeat protein
MSLEDLNQIIQQLRQEETRWEAILALKLLNGTSYLDALINLLQDENWIIRWCVSEKLGDICHPAAIEPLLDLLEDTMSDPDFHVRKNTIKALKRYRVTIIPSATKRLASKSLHTRKLLIKLLMEIGDLGLPALKVELLKTDHWIVANHILYIIWKIAPQECEDFFISMLPNPLIQKNIIVLLGLLKSQKAVPYFIQYYEKPELKRIILYGIKFIGQDNAFPEIVKSLASKKNRLLTSQIIKKIGPAILMFLVKGFFDKNIPRKVVLNLILEIGPEKIMPKLENMADKDSDIKILYELLKKNFQPKSYFSVSNFFGIFGE